MIITNPVGNTVPTARSLLSKASLIPSKDQWTSQKGRVLHNHPSGDPTPSRADIQMTQQIITVANPLGISVHDHIIVGKDGHASFKGLGLI